MRIFAIGLGLILVTGCNGETSTPGARGLFHPAVGHDRAPMQYVVDPPDEIVILAPGISELNGVKQTVSAEGSITVSLLGTVSVAGQRPDDIAAMLKTLMKPYYARPDIKIIVNARSKFYYVFGKGINSAGARAYTGRDTVIRALAEAGLNENGWPEKVHVSRPIKGDRTTPETVIVDFTQVFERGDLSQNFLLEEGDILFVPDSPLHAFGATVGQLTGAVGGSSSLVTAGGGIRP